MTKNERDQQIVAMRETAATLEEIGEHFGITRERVRQIVARDNGITNGELNARRAAAVDAQDRALSNSIGADLEAHPGSTIAEVAERLGIQRHKVARLVPPERDVFVIKERKPRVQHWTDDAILEAIRRAATYHYPLTGTAYGRLLALGEVVGPSQALVSKRFGSWTNACELAGIEAGRAPHGGYQSKWTDADMLGIVERYLRLPNSKGTYAGYDTWAKTVSEAPSGATVRNRLGSWADAKRQALSNDGPAAEEIW